VILVTLATLKITELNWTNYNQFH